MKLSVTLGESLPQKTLESTLQRMGLAFETQRLESGNSRISISLEKIVDGCAVLLPQAKVTELEAYIKHNKISFEWSADYRHIFVPIT